MITLEWDKKFEIGHARIDFEHRIFLDLIRSLSAAIEKGLEKEYVHRLMTEISLYAEFHFYSEETIMLTVAYPELDRHRQEHRQLLSEYRDHLYKYHQGATPGKDVVEFIFTWFALHTTQVDKRIAAYIGNKKDSI